MKHADLVPPNIQSLVPYPPGKPLSELERELGIAEAIKLASNENPFGPSPRAVLAMQRVMADLHRYPDGGWFYVRTRLARHLGVDPAQIVLGCGSNELIELIIRTFAGPATPDAPARGVLTSETTFVVYQLVSQAHGAPFRAVPMRGMAYDLDAIAAAVEPTTRVIFLCNPNNPTGSHFGQAALDRFVAAIPEHVLLVLDEAYWEFVPEAERPDSLGLLARRPRTVLLRTFSKAYGLAGARVGYGVTDPELAGYLDRVRQPFNVSSLAQAGAQAALDDTDYLAHVVEATRVGLDRLAEGLRALGMTPYPTRANFVLFDCHQEAGPLYDALLRRGVIVRPMRGYGLPAHLRVNAGTPSENERFLTTFADVLAARAAP